MEPLFTQIQCGAILNLFFLFRAAVPVIKCPAKLLAAMCKLKIRLRT